MNTIKRIVLSSAATAIATMSAFAQGTFQNLDFESASLSPVPPNKGPVFVPVTSGLPGWNAYVGSTQLTQIVQNNYTGGEASVDIFGPNYPAASSLSSVSPGVIDGNYSVLLQAGGEPGNSAVPVSASIAQTATVPFGSQSIEFKAWETIYTQFTVSLDGNNLSPIELGTGQNYITYGANIPTSLDGQSAQLEFTANYATVGLSMVGLDDIAFSPTAVPEPNPLALTGIGGLLFALYRRLARRSGP